MQQIIEIAHGQNLSDRPEWRALLHYKAGRFSSGIESLVDSDNFFLSTNGKHDPQAELDATLEAFTRADESDPENSAQCRFVARFHWLDQVLKFDQDRMPHLPCRRYHRWLEEMKPRGLTLVFPAAYMNNPASMFGHTLLRVDEHGQDEQTRLLAHTINYAADTREQHGIRFAFKGLFGYYRGKFSIAPYYLEVKAYGDIENRDIWEYTLNLSGSETTLLLSHLWEMRQAWFNYYFLDENCSYNLLSLLEAARPGLNLTDRFLLWVIPSETIRAVSDSGMITNVRFRPSGNTILRKRISLLDARSQMIAGKLARGELEADSDQVKRLSPVEQARVIELAIDYGEYLRSPTFGGKARKPATAAGADLLIARSRLDVPDQTPVIPMPDVWPGEGHKPARAGIGYGYEDRLQFVEFTASPGYHDLLDPEGGFTRGTGINALKAALRYYPEENKTELERLDIIDIISLSPWNRLMHPVSWKIDLGVERKHFDSSDRPLMGLLDGGFGISREFSDRTMAYAFAEGALEISDRLKYVAAPGAGSGIGVIHDFTKRWRSGLFLNWRFFFLGETRNDYEAVLKNRITLTGQSITGLDLEWKREFDRSYPGIKLYLQLYF